MVERLVVALEDESKTGEGEVRIVMRDGLRFPDDDRGQSTSRDDGRYRSDLLDDSIDESVDLTGESVDGSRLQGFDRVLADR